MNRFWLIFLIVGISYGNDTLKKNTTVKPEHSPRKAAVLSAIIPGLGQAYNRSWWKIPVVYASLGAFTYFAIDNHKQYTFVRNNLIAEADQNPNTVNVTGLPAAQLSEIKRQYKNRRDLCIAGAIAVYV
ncbi:MAG: DUF5683 domain-containing protein, partial [Bacteroidia bacterium]|nr:DUF5683 domain-containing protein [Bacteroidia bacterium]